MPKDEEGAFERPRPRLVGEHLHGDAVVCEYAIDLCSVGALRSDCPLQVFDTGDVREQHADLLACLPTRSQPVQAEDDRLIGVGTLDDESLHNLH